MFYLMVPGPCSKGSTVTLQHSGFSGTDLLPASSTHCHLPPASLPTVGCGPGPGEGTLSAAPSALPSPPQLSVPHGAGRGKENTAYSTFAATDPSGSCSLPALLCVAPPTHASFLSLCLLALSLSCLVSIVFPFRAPGEAWSGNTESGVNQSQRRVKNHYDTAHIASDGDCGRDNGSKYLRNTDSLLCVECDLQMWFHLSPHLLS